MSVWSVVIACLWCFRHTLDWVRSCPRRQARDEPSGTWSACTRPVAGLCDMLC